MLKRRPHKNLKPPKKGYMEEVFPMEKATRIKYRAEATTQDVTLMDADLSAICDHFLNFELQTHQLTTTQRIIRKHFLPGDADGYIWSKSFLFLSKRKQEPSGHQDHRNFFIQTDVIVSNFDGSYHSESKATITCPISGLTRDSILGNIRPCHFV